MKYKVLFKVGDQIEDRTIEVNSVEDVKVDFRFINFGNKLFINYENFVAFEEVK